MLRIDVGLGDGPRDYTSDVDALMTPWHGKIIVPSTRAVLTNRAKSMKQIAADISSASDRSQYSLGEGTGYTSVGEMPCCNVKIRGIIMK